MAQAILTPAQRKSLEEWLAFYGFKANPFSEYQAQLETDRDVPGVPDLSDYFIDTPFYNDILGLNEPPRTMLVYAARGCGKSAHRIMIERACRPSSSESRILAITYDDFGYLAEVARQRAKSITALDHVAQIMGIGVEVFIDALLDDPILIQAMGLQWLGQLKWLCLEYNPQVISAPNIYTRLSRLPGSKGLTFNFDDFLLAYSTQRLLEHLKTDSVFDLPSAQFIDRLVRTVPEPGNAGLSASGRFQQFETLVQRSGLTGIYVLVDGLDEPDPLSSSADLAIDILAPLLSDLKLIGRKHSAFKFFLPLEIRDKLASKPGIRHVLLTPREITWEPALLARLLEQRLSAFSGGQITDMAALCDPSLSTTITADLIRHSRNIPRNLMRLGEMLLFAHTRQGRSWQLLSMDDWENALSEFYDTPPEEWPLSSLPPVLRLDEKRQAALLGTKHAQLTDAEFALLKFLYERPDQIVDYTSLYDKLGLTKDNLYQIVKRIRQKIEADPKHPIYLKNEYGRGLWLDNSGRH